MTRKLASIVFVVLALALALAAQTAPDAAAPAGPVPIKIGIVDIQRAIVATNEGQRDFQNLDKKFEPKRTALQKDSADLEEMQKQLQTQGDKLNDSARNDLQKNIEAKKKTFQRNYEDAQSDWQGQQGEIANRIGGKMLEVIEKYASANGYAVVLDASQSNQSNPILYASAASNITKAIVDAYNVQSNVPPPPAPANAASGAPAKPSTTGSPAKPSTTGAPARPSTTGAKPAGSTAAPKQ